MSDVQPTDPARPTYRASAADRTFDVHLAGDDLRLDGVPVDYAFEPLGGNAYALVADGRTATVVVEAIAEKQFRVTLGGRQIEVRLKDEKDLLLEQFGLADAGASAVREVRAPMPGLVVSLAVEPGREVAAGDGLLVLEAMKMENELRAEAPGVVRAVHVAPGDAVGKNALLLEFE